mmetsp:Transcript_6524/g.11670  ORF Transcript_6524/g.11670 Transcript_6524/m.11670 type:complete len:398 (-) Transcript_6524:76-1269(-)
MAPSFAVLMGMCLLEAWATGDCPENTCSASTSGHVLLQASSLVSHKQRHIDVDMHKGTENASIRFMSYNLFGWNAFNVNPWKSDNVLRKISDWGPGVLGAQEVEKGGYGYDEVKERVKGTGVEHAGGSQFFRSEVVESHETAWKDLVGGYWLSMRRYKLKASGLYFLFFNSHWKHDYGMEQAQMVADTIHAERQKYGSPPTVLVGDTNQFCLAYQKDAIKYLKGEIAGSPVTFFDTIQDTGKSFSDNNNPDCRVDFIFASIGQWQVVQSFIDRDGMGADGSASDHAALMAELLPLPDDGVTPVPVSEYEYQINPEQGTPCPNGWSDIPTKADCDVAMTALGKTPYQTGQHSWSADGTYCINLQDLRDKMTFNTHPTGGSHGYKVCRRQPTSSVTLAE